MVQSITVVGRLGRDPEAKVLPGGETVAEFSLATERVYADRQGRKQRETTWFRVTAYGRQAEAVQQCLGRGRLALVEGRLSVDAATGGPRAWIGRDGAPKATFDLVASTVRFLSPPDGETATGAERGRGEDVPF